MSTNAYKDSPQVPMQARQTIGPKNVELFKFK